MSAPVYLNVMSNGALWVSNRHGDVPTGTITGTFKFSSDAKFQKIGTLSGTVSSSLTQVGANGKNGVEIT